MKVEKQLFALEWDAVCRVITIRALSDIPVAYDGDIHGEDYKKIMFLTIPHQTLRVLIPAVRPFIK